MVASGSARKTTRTRTSASSAPWAMRSLQCERWRSAATRTGRVRVVATAASRLEEAHPLGQELQRQPAADLEALLGQEVEREVDRDRLRAHRLGGDSHQAV